jgi:hypothetical protein
MKWKGDIQKSPLLKEMLPFHIECKDQRTLRLKQWIKQAEEDCPPDEIPTVVFHVYNSSTNYITIPLEDFLKFVRSKT